MNPVGWFEIYVNDMARAKAFYETVLEVELQALPMPDIEMQAFTVSEEGYGATGSLVKMPDRQGGGGGTTVYFSCDDCANEASRVVAAGGTLEQDKFSIGEYGFCAMVIDTEGNLIGLHSKK